MIPDLINGVFEFGGSLLIWMNVRQIRRDKGYAGLYWPAIAFFAGWGFWNLFYYPALGQWFSFAGGTSIVVANTTWLYLMRCYGPKS